MMMIVTMTVTAEEGVQRLKNRRRKRKSYSSADEMLSFLQSYTDRKDKAEEEKIKLLREMQQKKDEIFSQFLDVQKKKKTVFKRNSVKIFHLIFIINKTFFVYFILCYASLLF